MATIDWESEVETAIFGREKKVHWEKPVAAEDSPAGDTLEWLYRKSITLSRASGAVTNYQMKLLVGESAGATGENVDCGGKCNADFSDLRFTTSDGETLLDHYIESITGTTPNQLATVWIEFDSIGTGATTFYMLYGNDDSANGSNGTNTFIFFDDFNSLNDGALNGQNGWSGSTGFVVQAAVKYEGAKAVSVQNPTAAEISQTVSIGSFNMFVQAQIKAVDAGLTAPITLDLLEGFTLMTGIRISGDQLQHLITSATYQNVMAASDDTWYKIRIAIDGSTTHAIWINDVLKDPASHANQYEIMENISKIRIGSYNNPTAINYVDQIFVGQYLATGPAWGSWGDEEEGTYSLAA